MSDLEPRVLQWRDLPRAARMMAHVYSRWPLRSIDARWRAVLTWAVTFTFALILAAYRPLVRHWLDPEDSRKQVVIAFIPRRQTIIPRVRVVIGLGLYIAAYWYLESVRWSVVVAGVAGCAAIIPALWVLKRSPEDKFRCRRAHRESGTQLTAILAASTTKEGMRLVKAYLLQHHGGQRLTVRVRDAAVLKWYETLGLEVVHSGCGRMTRLIPQDLPERHQNA